jgi:hypothetical protein
MRFRDRDEAAELPGAALRGASFGAVPREYVWEEIRG